MLSEAPSAREVKLAKSLVHPEKEVRDKTIQTVQSYVSSITDIDDMEMLKLWKSLYYCLWLADKSVVQLELSNELANLTDRFKNHKLRVKYFTLFFRIILREWSFLDQYRVNKFYSLIRIMLNKIFQVLKDKNWDETAIQQMCTMLDKEVLTKTPNGIRYHIADIYLPELLKVTEGVIDTKVFDKLLAPFYASLVRADDASYIERVNRAVFGGFVQTYCAEAKAEDQSSASVFSTVNTKFVQKKIFDIASDEQTSERFRKRLYDLHKSIATKTRVQFVSDDMLVDESNSQVKEKKSKKEKRALVTESEPVAEQPTAKKQKSEVEAQQQKKASEEPKAESIQSKTKTTSKKETSTPAEVPKKTPSKPAEPEPVQTPVAEQPKKKSVKTPAEKKETKEEVTDTVSKIEEEKASFIASKKFAGAKNGYVFKKGDNGLGYYIDQKPQSAFKKVSFSKNVKGNNNKKR